MIRVARPAERGAPVDDDGVDEAREEASVREVGIEHGTLRDGPRHDRRRRRRKRPVEQEARPLEGVPDVDAREREVGEADEPVVVVAAVGKGVAKEVEDHGPDARVEQVLQQDVLQQGGGREGRRVAVNTAEDAVDSALVSAVNSVDLPDRVNSVDLPDLCP